MNTRCIVPFGSCNQTPLLAKPSLAALLLTLAVAAAAPAAESPPLHVGIAVRDVSPELPIRLAGYAGRKRPADRAEHPLLAQALAFKNSSGERFVVVALDNCEVSHDFMQPVLREIEDKFQLRRGSVAVVSSHTHSGPVLADTLVAMGQPPAPDQQCIENYSRVLQRKLVEVVGTALEDFKPARLEYGQGRAGFAMNRRVYKGGKVVFGDNPDGPTDWDVPVLRITGTNGAVRAIVFGYACHGTSVRSGDDWYAVSGEYMAYARHHLEAAYPGATGVYLTGMGADVDPAPRGLLSDAKRHGLELAGAVVGALGRPMRPIQGEFKYAYDEIELPLTAPPSPEQLEKDARGEDVNIKLRAEHYLKMLKDGKALPESIRLPAAVLRFGKDLTLVLMGGEVVVDYSRRLKRLLADDYPWTVGYAYEVPCYIPSLRIVKEGGYESESSLIYYGIYGPFRGEVEDVIIDRITAMAAGLR